MTDSTIPGDTAADDRLWSTSLRMTIALVSLVSGLVALYLHLWKFGYMGALSCGAGGGCVTVQYSRFGSFLGQDVALIGAVGWAAVVVVAVLGTLPRWAGARWPTVALMALVYPAVLFTVRLKYGEFVVLKSFCPWCVPNLVAVVAGAVLVTLDWRRVRRLERQAAAD